MNNGAYAPGRLNREDVDSIVLLDNKVVVRTCRSIYAFHVMHVVIEYDVQS